MVLVSQKKGDPGGNDPSLEIEAHNKENVDKNKSSTLEVVGLAFDREVVYDDDSKDDGEHHEERKDEDRHVVVHLVSNS